MCEKVRKGRNGGKNDHALNGPLRSWYWGSFQITMTIFVPFVRWSKQANSHGVCGSELCSCLSTFIHSINLFNEEGMYGAQISGWRQALPLVETNVVKPISLLVIEVSHMGYSRVSLFWSLPPLHTLLGQRLMGSLH